MKKVLLVALLSLGVVASASAQTTEFAEGTIGTIRQDTTTNLVRFNLNGGTIDGSTCANRDFAVVFLNDEDNFKNIYAGALTARALGSTVEISYVSDVCAAATPGGAIFAIGNGLIIK